MFFFTGAIDACKVHPRVVAQRALHHNAAAVVLFHNHPSGNPKPSAADRAITARLKQALALLDIRALDGRQRPHEPGGAGGGCSGLLAAP